MADKPTLNTLAGGARLSVTEVNANFDTLATAIEACLGRGGVSESPNSMSGNLDMNTNEIINVATPTTESAAATKAYADSVAANIDIDTATAADLLDSIKTVDGAGSGLDSDLFDGLDSTDYLKIDGTNPLDNNTTLKSRNAADSADIDLAKANASDEVELGDPDGATKVVSNADPVARVSGTDYTLWHSGNDGDGSGLAADQEPTGIYHGRVGGDGTAVRLPSGWTSTEVTTGNYTVTHNLGSQEYTLVLTLNDPSETKGSTSIAKIDINDFDVNTYDSSFADASRPWTFTLIVD